MVCGLRFKVEDGRPSMKLVDRPDGWLFDCIQLYTIVYNCIHNWVGLRITRGSAKRDDGRIRRRWESPHRHGYSYINWRSKSASRMGALYTLACVFADMVQGRGPCQCGALSANQALKSGWRNRPFTPGDGQRSSTPFPPLPRCRSYRVLSPLHFCFTCLSH